jgi:hypothetical protein
VCLDLCNTLVDFGIAVRANDPEIVPYLLEKLSGCGSKPSVDDNDTRIAMLTHAKALVRALQTPREAMIEQNWAQVCYESLQSSPVLSIVTSRVVILPSQLATMQVCSEYSETNQ